MRRFGIALAFGLYVLGLSCALHATGNVLLPSNDQNSSKLPNLGLVPEDNAAEAQKDSAPADTKAEQSTTLPPATPAQPAPSSTAPLQQSKPVLSEPQIMKMPDTAAMSNPAESNLPNSINIALADNNQWGALDMETLHSMLGIGSDQLMKHCRLSLNGTVTTDKGVYSFNMGSIASQTAARYDGTPTNISINVQALCDKMPLPDTTTFIVQVGNKYAVYLSQTICSRPNGQRLIFRYKGDGSGECL